MSADFSALKNGVKTSEFWLTVLAFLAAFGMWLAGYLPSNVAIIVTTLASSIYTLSRGISKAAGGTNNAKLLTDLMVALQAAGAAAGKAAQPGANGVPQADVGNDDPGSSAGSAAAAGVHLTTSSGGELHGDIR